METPTIEEVQARHRRELKDLQGRITSKKKNASKKTRKGVNDECAAMERDLKEKQASELAALSADASSAVPEGTAVDRVEEEGEEMEKAVEKLHLGGGEGEGAARDGADNESPSSQPGSSAQAGGGGGGGGKKRNRQKERLARRAAEQEEATVRAEQEASSMTDHRALESASMQRTMATHSLVEHAIAPDGHCLFSAVADQLTQSSIPLSSHGEPAYRTVRRDASAYMLEHPDDFAPFLEEPVDGYARRMRETAEWGGPAGAHRPGEEVRRGDQGRPGRGQGGEHRRGRREGALAGVL